MGVQSDSCVGIELLASSTCLWWWPIVCQCVSAGSLPALLGWLQAPANVSSDCEDLLDQLNDVSFLGNKKFKDSCMHLRWSLTNLNRSQGLGFLVFSVRACPLHLPVVVVCAIAAFTKTSSGPQ